MKRIIIIGDGMSDWPVDSLAGKTPLQVAHKPHIDKIARLGRMGLLETLPEGQPKGSAVANMSVLGYDPVESYQGRAVLEAASMGVTIESDEVALRCNLIALEDGRIKNHSAQHIATDEAEHLVFELNKQLGSGRGPRPVTFHRGVSYRHLLVLNGGWASPSLRCAPPHDHVGELVSELMPVATSDDAAARATQERLVELFEASTRILPEHPVNLWRATMKKDKAAAIWTWSPGRRPHMQTLRERFGITGAVISAVDLVRGLGVLAGMEVIRVPGATGLEDTNYEGKAEACLKALESCDLVYLHVEATDEAGHARDLELKIRCIEYLDQRLVRLVLDGLAQKNIQAAVAILPDHPTPVSTGKHANDPVPFAIWRPDWEPDECSAFDEEQAKLGALGFLRGVEFMSCLLG